MNRVLLMFALTLMVCSLTPALAADTDGDGLADEHEAILGTDPKLPETLVMVNESGPVPEKRRGAGYDATKDVLSIEFCHVAEDRYLWRTTFAAAPRIEDMVHHYYIDADNDPKTGREGQGVDYMLSVVKGGGTSTYYAPDGKSTSGPAVNFAVAGNTLLVTADCNLARDERGVRFSMRVLSHTAVEKPEMSDSVATFTVQGIAVNDRTKIIRPQDLTTPLNVTGTFGLDIIRPMLADKRNLAVNYDELNMDGFSVDLFTQNRYGHVKMDRRGGRVSTTVPKAGKYHVGFMIYDDSNAERVGVYVNDEFVGLALINGNNNRTWIYHLSTPRDLKAGDRIALEAMGAGGKHGICNILFMPNAPAVRKIEYHVQNTRWIAPVGTDGEVSLSWTTTWPSASRFEYGTTAKYGQVATEECNRLVHRAYLTGLKAGATYHGRGVGTNPDGSLYYGPDVTFTADGVDAPRTREGITRVPLTVRNPHGVDAVASPVTSGIPFPKGALGSDRDLRVVLNGKEVLAQIKPLGTWEDGSLKWVLVTLLADVPAGKSANYVLELGRGVKRVLNAQPLATQAADKSVSIDTGAAKFSVTSNGDLAGPNGRCETQLVGEGGTIFTSERGPGTVIIEEAGPVRVVIKTISNVTAADGSKSFRIEQRLTAWRGRPVVQVQHTFINDREERFTNIESLSYLVPSGPKAWTASLADAEPLALAQGEATWQRLDREYLANGKAAAGRLSGGVVAADGSLGVTVRDCWQNYPKGFAVTDRGLRVDLAPDFEKGLYESFPFEKEGHHLYYYLRDGHYRFKQGMSKTHDLLLDFGGKAAADGQIFQRPLQLTATPAWYTGTMAFYNVAPRNEKLFAAYEKSVDSNIKAYAAARERQHDYGLMNYGDWFGERGANWGNIEYDTQHAFFLEYIRSGNLDAFFLGNDAELHNRDVDTVQWGPDQHGVGLAMVHQMGHLGGYYTETVPGTLGIPNAGGSVTHAWTEGHFDHYYLTGDPRSLETGMAVVNYFTDKELSRPYDWLSAREPGWHLIMLASALAATNDPYYLNACRVVVDRTLETQDPAPRELPKYQQEPGMTHQNGGWTRMMVPGHCECEPRHRGNANFMIAVLLTGLTYYHDVTNEPAVKDSIIRGSRYLVETMYSKDTHGFRYTPCPNMRYTSGVSPLMAEGIARAYRWTRDPIFTDALTNGLALGASGAGYGKSFSMYYRCAARLLADLAAMGLTIDEARRMELTQFTKPDWMKAIPEGRMIVVQAEDFTAQDGGNAEIVSDRHAAWGTAITKWHMNVGHWLQWKFKVPEAGRYRVMFRYGTLNEKSRRRVEIDGALPDPAAADVLFPRTGGFGASPKDWNYVTLKDAAGQDVAVSLKAGDHTLKMTNLGDGLAMDFVALVRVD
ncbi:MAG: RIFT barrel domain-containing protein [Armatimonadota bacterium]